jgi:hypothetical protein
MMNLRKKSVLLAVCMNLFACGSSDDDADGTLKLNFPNQGNAQTPPTTGDAQLMNAWLNAGHYKSWQCEADAHTPKGPSMHGMNRVCSNDLVSAFTGKATDERPAGSAAVKEFWNAGKVIGRAAYVKTAAKSNNGDSWFWYVELEGMGVPANGFPAQDAVAKTACVGCHTSAGSDAEHTTSSYSGDFVYTQVER